MKHKEATIMSRHKTFLNGLGTGLVAALAMVGPGCNGTAHEAPRLVGPEIIVIRLPERFGPLQRPPVEFNHGLHAVKLEDKGCTACHLRAGKKGLTLKMGRADDGSNRDALMNLYHDQCMGCHKQRLRARKKTGPVTCGKCHLRRHSPLSRRMAMTFDRSLHYRHVRAMKEECKECHHVLDKATKKLVYKKGEESACFDCHGDKDDGKKLSLRNASHRDCITCHLSRRQAGHKAGPVYCVKCHDARERQDIVKLDDKEIPRLKRGQKDRIWLRAPGAKSRIVPYDHEAHENRAPFCTTCHHKELKACRKCHSVDGKKKGQWVTIERAFHLVSSDHSCVGCHKKESDKKDCAGCHRRLWDEAPRKRSCKICHSGSLPRPGIIAAPTPWPAEARLALLPLTSDDFPEKVVIKKLAKKYKPSNLPHRRIVGRLDIIIRGSELAKRFHAKTETMCNGCHHNMPVGKRPSPCGACHGVSPHATKDRPALRTAYHRQCMGCHQQMAISKQRCTDCHAKATKAVKKEVKR